MPKRKESSHKFTRTRSIAEGDCQMRSGALVTGKTNFFLKTSGQKFDPPRDFGRKTKKSCAEYNTEHSHVKRLVHQVVAMSV